MRGACSPFFFVLAYFRQFSRRRAVRPGAIGASSGRPAVDFRVWVRPSRRLATPAVSMLSPPARSESLHQKWCTSAMR